MSDDAQSSRQPRCMRCGGELVEEDFSGLWRPVGLLLLAVAVLVLPLWPFSARSEACWVASAVAAVLGLALMRRRMCWRCVECRAAFKRRLPPRAERVSKEGEAGTPACSERDDALDED